MSRWICPAFSRYCAMRCDAMADGVDYSLQVTCSMDDDSGNRAMNDLHDFTELFGISSEH